MEAMLYGNERRIDAAQVRSALKRVRDTRGNDGKGLAGVEGATGISRSTLSQFVNNNSAPDPRKLEALAGYLEAEYGYEFADDADAPGPTAPAGTDRPTAAPAPAIQRFGIGGRIYSTTDYVTAFGAMDEFRRAFATCVMIGHPGTGKTTVLKEYARQREDTWYVDCWPYMGTRDLLESIAEAMGITLKAGTVMKATRQLLGELNHRPGGMLIYDEAENLRGDNVKKLDTLRKLCDNTPTTALFAGTLQLEEALTKGSGMKSLAQITRRNRMIRMRGVKAEEVREMLKEYDLDQAAREGLIKIATDTAHGGMGNFVELLNICLNAAGSGAVTGRMLDAAKRYKLLF